MTGRDLPSAPTVEYGAPSLPITTTRRTGMNVVRDEHSSSGALDPQATGELVERITAAETSPITGPGEWSAHTISSDAKPLFVDVDVTELDAEQQRWLPDPIPPGLRVVKCTACGSMRADMPGPGLDPWKNHELECEGFAATADEDDNLERDEHGIPTQQEFAHWAPHEITEWLADVEADEDASEDHVRRARQAVSKALGVED
ncbi:hypothetical protein [Streptomyces ipomoeae]|uniref:hypothetical protein n=1 Tax=Streptomyces ipomoeae TaxID=103232 RepID=UPI0029A265EF|nr:hypothetical protein [Streptomyces ipomoeae]MDX2695941.1 hypothetical protein [Streptomyces ipomoeae]MDX2843377.1 hypothetical protein [Streptomyces ipomoeae]